MRNLRVVSRDMLREMEAKERAEVEAEGGYQGDQDGNDGQEGEEGWQIEGGQEEPSQKRTDVHVNFAAEKEENQDDDNSLSTYSGSGIIK